MTDALAVNSLRAGLDPRAQQRHGGPVLGIVPHDVESEWKKLLRTKVDGRGVDHRADEALPGHLPLAEQGPDAFDEQIHPMHLAMAPLVVGHAPRGRLFVVPRRKEAAGWVDLMRQWRGS